MPIKRVFIVLLCLIFIHIQSALALTNSIEALSPEFDSIIQISSEANIDPNDQTTSYCNATLINSHVAVTAAHCALIPYLTQKNIFNLKLGSYKYNKNPNTGKIVRIGYVTHFEINLNVNILLPHSILDKAQSKGANVKISPDEDIAIIWWKESIPELIKNQKSSLLTLEEHAAITKNLPQAILKTVTVNPIIDPTTSDSRREAVLDQVAWKNYVQSTSRSRVEPGDSGAPLFVQIGNKFKIFSLVKGKGSTFFSNWDAYSPLRPQVCDLVKELPTFITIPECHYFF